MRKILAVALLTVVLTACGGKSSYYRFEPDVNPNNPTDLNSGCGIVQYVEKDSWRGQTRWWNLGRVCFVEEER